MGRRVWLIAALCAGTRAMPFYSALQTSTAVLQLRNEDSITKSGGLFQDESSSTSYVGFKKMRNSKRAKKSQIVLAQPSNCFPSSFSGTPALDDLPQLENWWCDQKAEHAFLGWTYDLSICPSPAQLLDDFVRMKTDYFARYVRVIGSCSLGPLYEHVVDAAGIAGLGVYATIDLSDNFRNDNFSSLHELVSVVENNLKAPYIIRNIAVGSDPLYEQVFTAGELASELKALKSIFGSYGIHILSSDLPYAYQTSKDADQVIATVDTMGLNIEPYFSAHATEGDQAWSYVENAMLYGISRSSEPIRITQTGWPTDESSWKPTSHLAVADASNSQSYYELLDSQCEFFRDHAVGWFAHTWKDSMLRGWGLLDMSGQPKFDFAARTTCWTQDFFSTPSTAAL